MLIDTHCHLDFPDFAAERDAVLASLDGYMSALEGVLMGALVRQD